MFSSYLVLLMRGDRTAVSPTELAQLSRCEQQLLFDAQYGSKRSRHWRARSVEGDQVHAQMHRRVTQAKSRTGSPKWLVAVACVLLGVLVLWLVIGR